MPWRECEHPQGRLSRCCPSVASLPDTCLWQRSGPFGISFQLPPVYRLESGVAPCCRGTGHWWSSRSGVCVPHAGRRLGRARECWCGGVCPRLLPSHSAALDPGPHPQVYKVAAIPPGIVSAFSAGGEGQGDEEQRGAPTELGPDGKLPQVPHLVPFPCVFTGSPGAPASGKVSMSGGHTASRTEPAQTGKGRGGPGYWVTHVLGADNIFIECIPWARPS